MWQAYGADLLIFKIHIVPLVGLEPNTGISAQQIFLLLYVTIAKQIVLPLLGFILPFYTDCAVQSFVCCSLEYIITILKFLQDIYRIPMLTGK